MTLRSSPALLLALLLTACGPPAATPPAAYELVLVSLNGERQVLGTVPGTAYAPRLSREGRHLVFDDQANDASKLYVAAIDDVAGRTVLPALEGGNAFPLWSFDDEHILSVATRDGELELFSQPADGSGRPEVVASPARAPEAWTPNGRLLNFITLTGGDYAIATWDRYDKTVTRLVQRDGSLQHSSHYSPDGRWLVYASNETGAFEIFVEPVPSTGARYRVTNGGGEHPLWTPDGGSILFDRAAELYRVRVTTANDAFTAGEPEALPIKGFAQLAGLRRQFDIAPDGRLLMLFPVD